MNGRIGKDKNVGDFTCYIPGGSSVVDYFVALEHFIKFTSILDISEYLDHCLIVLDIDISRDRQIFERVRAESKDRQENSQASLLSTFTKWNNTLDREVALTPHHFCSYCLS